MFFITHFSYRNIIKIFCCLLIALFLTTFVGKVCFADEKSELIKIYTTAKKLFDQGKYREAVINYEKGLEMAKKSGDKKKILAFLSGTGICYQKSGNLLKAVICLEDAVKLAEEIKAYDMESYINSELGYTYFDLKEFKKAGEAYKKVLEYAEKNHDNETKYEMMGNLGDVYSRLGMVKESNHYYKLALENAQKTGNKEKEMYYLGNIGFNLAVLGKHLEAFKYHRQAADLAKELKNTKGLNLWLTAAAQDLFEAGSYEKALEHYKEALDIAKNTGNEPTQVLILRSMGSSYYGLGRYKKAMDYYKKALNIAQKNGDGVSEAKIFGSLGNLYSSIGDMKTAENYMKKALESSKHSADKRDEIHDLSVLGLFYFDTGRYKKALEYYNKALIIAKKTGDIYGETNVLTELFNIHIKLGDVYKGSKCLVRALELSKNNKPLQIAIYTQVGIIEFQHDRLRKSLKNLKTALKLSREINSKKDESLCLHYLGELYQQAGKYKKALKYYTSALKIVKETENVFLEIYLLNKLAFLEGIDKHFDKALDYYDKSFSLAQKTGNKRAQYEIMKGKGIIYYNRGDKKKALEYFEKVRKYYKETNDEEKESLMLMYLAQLNLDNKNDKAALSNLNRALTLAEKNQHQALMYELNRKLAFYYNRKKDMQKSLDYLKKAVAIYEDTFEKARVDSLQVDIFGKSRWFVENYEEIIKILLSQGKVKEAFEYSERARARKFLESLQGRKILPRDIKHQELAREELLVSDNIKKLRMKLAKVSKMDSESISIRKQIKKLVEKREQLLVKIKLEDPEYSSLISVNISGIKEIRDSLQPEEALIEYFIGMKESYVWCITKEKFTCHTIPAGRDSIAKDIVSIRGDIIHSTEMDLDKEIDGKLKKFNTLVFKPVENDIKGKKSLVIVPHASLHKLPFAILKNQKGSYLVSDYAVLTEPSSSSFVLFRKRNTKRPAKAVQFALGDIGNKEGKSSQKTRELSSDEDFENFYRGGFNPLPGTKNEVKEIKEILDKNNINNETFIETEFTYDNAKKSSPEAGFLHFATHGFISDKFLGHYSGLVTGDNPIFVLDIFEWSLNARMVVLSACKTGLGHQSYGDDVVGLSRAFMQAGADNLAATLWIVEDQTTRKLMVKFYSNLVQGKTPQESLRIAQLHIMKTKPNPFFWGPFVVYGKGEREQ